MTFQLMTLQVHLRLKHNELLLQAFPVQAKEVAFLEVVFEGVIVEVVLLLAMSRSSVADVASLMSVTTVRIQLVISVEPFTTETAFRVPSETALVNRARDVVSVLFVLAQLRRGEDFMFVSENFFVSSAKITISTRPFSNLTLYRLRYETGGTHTTSSSHVCS